MVTESLERLDPPVVLGKLKLLAKLGEGGMATVYAGAIGHGNLARLAAVKLLRADAPDADYRARFLDEANVVVRLHHNNLVDVREAGEVDGQLYIAMELVEGRDLADVWDRCAQLGRAFPLPIAVHLAREALRGLHYAHEFPGLGLVHRDISPSNILVDWAGAVRVADFGLATSSLKAAHTVPGMVFGKVAYMAPEQAVTGHVDARADVYSTGVVLWELLTGKPLRPTDVDAKGVAAFRAPSAASISTRLDDELDAIVQRALSHDPALRWETALDFMRALGEWLGKHAPATTQETLAEFMSELFGDASARDHAAYSSLLEAGRTRLLPAGDSGAPTRDVVDGEQAFLATEVLRAGTLIGERYRIERQIGRGGMGIVYLAEHVVVGRKVALKVLTREWSAHEIVARRFREEARAASLAGHPNIVEVFDAGELPDKRLYIAMEHLVGRTLYAEQSVTGPLEPERACRIIRDVARAVRAAHGVGVIHRDLKPDNVMLVERGEEMVVKVLDFGISASAGRPGDDKRLTKPGHALGTPEYMAPEQGLGHVATEQFDVYALGVMLYEMLAGEPPLVSDNAIELLVRKVSERAPPLDGRRAGLPKRLVELVHACLEYEPDKRPRGAADFLARLAEVEGELGLAPAATSLPHLRVQSPTSSAAVPRGRSASAAASASRRRGMAVGFATAAVALLVGALAWRASIGAEAQGGGTAAPSDPRLPSIAAASTDAVPSRGEAPEPAPPASDPVRAESGAASAPAPATPPAPTNADASEPAAPPQASALSPAECARLRETTKQARIDHAWKKVLANLRKDECWGGSHRELRTKLRVLALWETKRYAECARAGVGANDAQTQKRAQRCKVLASGN
jgi:serine/threonine-protein kinase